MYSNLENKVSNSNSRRISLIVSSVKLVIVLAILYVTYDFIWVQNSNTEFFSSLLNTFNTSNPIYLLLCICLAPFNWLLESIKWKRLIASFNPIVLSQSLKSILLGISFGVITPGRVGEYGGRLLNIEKENISKALFANFIGSIAQNLVNIIPGSIALYFFLAAYFQSEITALSISLFFFGTAILLSVIYFNSQNIITLFDKIPLLKKFTKQFETFHLSKVDLHFVLSLSILRFFIYVSQYILLLYYFQIDVSLFEAINSVVIIFLLQSSIPLPPIFGIIARTQIALFVLGVYAQNYTSILSVPVLLWAINLLIPSLSGAVILMKTNFNKYFQNV